MTKSVLVYPHFVDRPVTGRPFGFGGLHFHDNRRRDAYRTLVCRGILGSLGVDPKAASPLAPLDDAPTSRCPPRSCHSRRCLPLADRLSRRVSSPTKTDG